MQLLSTAESAKILGVSAATVRNWAKIGHLTPVSIKPAVFKQADVLDLKERIRTNRFNRLRKRANRSASDKFDAIELRDAKIAADISRFTQDLNVEGVDPQLAVFCLALYYLRALGEADMPDAGEPFEFDAICWRRGAVREVMSRWLARNGGVIYHANPNGIRAFLQWEYHDDPLGLLYQGLSSVGKKSRTGAYFTPGEIIDESLSDLGGAPSSFLDPCCGTGRYLLRAAERYTLSCGSVYGFDADPVAVDIACLNLLQYYSDLDSMPNVQCLDSLRDLANGEEGCLTNHLAGTIDAIATNPPWGGCKNQIRHRNLVELIKSGESFSLFLEKSLRLLRPGGHLSFILPESMLKIKAHADIRRVLLSETSIKRITLMGKIFAGVATPIIRLDLCKSKAPVDWRVSVICNDRHHEASQERFRANAHQAFDVTVTGMDAELLDRIYSCPHHTLRGNAEWALGIVTGDNANCVLEVPCEGSEPVLRGRDVFKFAPRRARCHIVFNPRRFQQVAPERIYRAPEKLIYRFISNRLVFAYDSEGLLTLNSANIVIPRLPHMSMKAALAFLNSTVFQYIFVKRFQTRKILKGDLETLPFPVVGGEVLARLEGQVDRCMGGEYGPAEELDRMVYEVFGLDGEAVRLLEEGLRVDSQREFL